MGELPKLRKKYSFLKEVDSMSLRSAIADLMVGFNNFERGKIVNNLDKR